jgi:hypothetical protein
VAHKGAKMQIIGSCTEIYAVYDNNGTGGGVASGEWTTGELLDSHKSNTNFFLKNNKK